MQKEIGPNEQITREIDTRDHFCRGYLPHSEYFSTYSGQGGREPGTLIQCTCERWFVANETNVHSKEPFTWKPVRPWNFSLLERIREFEEQDG